MTWQGPMMNCSTHVLRCFTDFCGKWDGFLVGIVKSNFVISWNLDDQIDSVFFFVCSRWFLTFLPWIHHRAIWENMKEYVLSFSTTEESQISQCLYGWAVAWNSSHSFYFLGGPFGLSDAHCMKFGLQCVCCCLKKTLRGFNLRKRGPRVVPKCPVEVSWMKGWRLWWVVPTWTAQIPWRDLAYPVILSEFRPNPHDSPESCWANFITNSNLGEFPQKVWKMLPKMLGPMLTWTLSNYQTLANYPT